MSGSISPPITGPTTTVAIKPLGADARAAAVQVVLDATRQGVTVSMAHLPPDQRFGPIGSIFVDNLSNTADVRIRFPDTGAINDIPANSGVWILGVTGGQEFQLASPVSVLTEINLTCLNKVVPPSGVQPVLVSANIGTVTVGAVTVAAGTLDLIGGVLVVEQVNHVDLVDNITNLANITNTVTVAPDPLQAEPFAVAPWPPALITPTTTAVAVAGTSVFVFPANDYEELLIQNTHTAATLFVGIGLNAGTIAAGRTFGVAPGDTLHYGPFAGQVTANGLTAGQTFSAIATQRS